LGVVDGAGLEGHIQAQRGKVVVVNFWATWCGPCLVEYPFLVELRRVYPERELFMVGISLDFDPQAPLEFAAREKPGYPMYLAASDVARAFDVGAIPKTMIWGPDGALAASHVGIATLDYLRNEVDRLLGRPASPRRAP